MNKFFQSLFAAVLFAVSAAVFAHRDEPTRLLPPSCTVTLYETGEGYYQIAVHGCSSEGFAIGAVKSWYNGVEITVPVDNSGQRVSWIPKNAVDQSGFNLAFEDAKWVKIPAFTELASGQCIAGSPFVNGGGSLVNMTTICVEDPNKTDRTKWNVKFIPLFQD